MGDLVFILIQQAGIQRNLYIRFDSCFVDVVSFWSVVVGNSQFNGTSVLELADGLYHAFSVSGCSDDRSNTIILHCTGKNL